MPIEFTPQSEESGYEPSKRRRRSSRQKRHRRHLILAFGLGVGLFLVLALALVPFRTLNPWATDSKTEVPVITVTSTDPYAANGETSFESGVTKVGSVGAESTDELPEDRLEARVLNVRRVAGGDGSTDHLQVEYEFKKNSSKPGRYLIVIQTPSAIGRVGLKADAARHDNVEMSMALYALGSRGPIVVWIESIVPEKVRVSNKAILK